MSRSVEMRRHALETAYLTGYVKYEDVVGTPRVCAVLGWGCGAGAGGASGGGESDKRSIGSSRYGPDMVYRRGLLLFKRVRCMKIVWHWGDHIIRRANVNLAWCLVVFALIFVVKKLKEARKCYVGLFVPRAATNIGFQGPIK